MNCAKLFLVIILLVVMAGCGRGSKLSTTDFITVDVNASYPEKELILQDIMDVEYVALETTDQFLTKGFVKAIGENIILVTNLGNDGDIFVFDRSGKGLRKINRFGQSGEEYSQITEIVLDEDNNEIFVVAYPERKIVVYDLFGNFKRSFKFTDTSYYFYTFNYDQDNLICYKGYFPSVETEQSCHLIISKQDGSITQEIQIPFKEIETPVMIKGETTIMPSFCLTIPYCGNWLLMKTSSDIVYNYLPDGTISPFIVRTPSIHSMDPKVFLFLNTLTDRYYFMQTMKKEVDFEKMKGFPLTDLVYDKQTNAIFKYMMYNADFSNKRQVSLDYKSENKEIITCQSLNAPDLVEAYEKGQLKGKLKEITAGLNEESNPVIMLVKHKKEIQ